MPKATMTSRQRVNAALERRDHDRIPRHETFWPDTIRRWKTEGLNGDAETVLERLGTDFQGLSFLWPCPFPGRRQVIEENEETILFTDAFGQTAREWKKRSGTPEHHGWECNSRDVWESTFKPAMLNAGPFIRLNNVEKRFIEGRAKDRWCYLAGVEVFETTRKMIGDEATMIALATEPDWIADVAKVTVDLLLRDYQSALDHGIKPDGLWTYGDMAYNHATMCSPKMYRELIWPQHKRLVDFAHANGMKFIYHTDGDVTGVMDLYLAAGFDALQPLEAKANMDVRKLVPQYGDKLSFFGNIDVMVMSTNDPDKIEYEMRTKFAAGMAQRGYMYHSDHSVPPAVSWETYQFIMKKVEELGSYA